MSIYYDHESGLELESALRILDGAVDVIARSREHKVPEAESAAKKLIKAAEIMVDRNPMYPKGSWGGNPRGSARWGIDNEGEYE